MVAAASLPGSEVVIEHVGLNPSRSGILDILTRMGANVSIDRGSDGPGEPVGTITVRHGGLAATEIVPGEVPGVIDELPVLGALATHGGELHVTGAGELRVKESDRISALAEGFRRMGGDIEEFPDGFHISGRERLKGGEVDARLPGLLLGARGDDDDVRVRADRDVVGALDARHGHELDAVREVGPSTMGLDGKKYAIGAKYVMTGSAEFEHYFDNGPWGAAVFVDAGDAFNYFGSSVSDPGNQDENFDIHTGVGFGVRWKSPVGPVRFDIAHGLNDADSDYEIYLNIGANW